MTSHLPQWQKSEEITKKFSGLIRYLLRILPNLASPSGFNPPTRIGTILNWSFLLKKDKKVAYINAENNWLIDSEIERYVVLNRTQSKILRFSCLYALGKGLPHKKIGDAHRKIWIKPVKGTNLSVSWTLSIWPMKDTKRNRLMITSHCSGLKRLVEMRSKTEVSSQSVLFKIICLHAP